MNVIHLVKRSSLETVCRLCGKNMTVFISTDRYTSYPEVLKSRLDPWHTVCNEKALAIIDIHES